jgi:hypothetical protein
MLDFAEVGRRIEQRNQQVVMTGETQVEHTTIIDPIVQQLIEGANEGNMLLAPHEVFNLVSALRRQAELLDEREAELDEATGFVEALNLRLRRYQLGTLVAALWGSAVLLGALL